MRLSSLVPSGAASIIILAACGGNEFSTGGQSTGGDNGTGAAGSGGSSAGAGAGGGAGTSGAGGATGGRPATGGIGGAGASGPTGGASGSAGAGTGGAPGTGGASTGGAGGVVINPACAPETPSCVLDWAGVHGWTGNSTDGVGTAARFGALGHITGDASHVYVSDANAIRRIAIATATVTTLAGALNQPGNVDLPGAEARFGNLSGITTDGIYVWVADMTNLSIRVVTIATGEVDTLALTSAAARGVTQYDLGAYLYYVTSDTESALYQVNKTTGATTQLVGAVGLPGLTDGNASLAQFNGPRTVFAVGDGQLMIGDTENHRVRGYDNAAGEVTTFAGTDAGFFDAPRASAKFLRLRGIHVHQAGNAMYIADSDNFAIRRLNLTTQYVSTIAGTATLAGHRDGIGTFAQFNKPMDVYYHVGANDLFILEDSVIRRMYAP